MWKHILREKYSKVNEEHQLNNIYYFFLLRAGLKFYICGCELNIDEINNLKVDHMTKTSVFIKDAIPEKFGKVKIYKSKKRMELRLKLPMWIKSNSVLCFTTDKTIPINNLRKN